MGFFDSFSDMLEAALPWSSAEAEAQKEEEEEDSKVCLFFVSGRHKRMETGCECVKFICMSFPWQRWSGSQQAGNERTEAESAEP
tara:strand:- start:409 stop:663 length:255 start_codon:yes stop_codon:yes gene_type:complete